MEEKAYRVASEFASHGPLLPLSAACVDLASGLAGADDETLRQKCSVALGINKMVVQFVHSRRRGGPLRHDIRYKECVNELSKEEGFEALLGLKAAVPKLIRGKKGEVSVKSVVRGLDVILHVLVAISAPLISLAQLSPLPTPAFTFRKSSFSIWIGNLPSSTTKQDVHSLLSGYTSLVSVSSPKVTKRGPSQVTHISHNIHHVHHTAHKKSSAIDS
jgi:hypothetical protein